MEDAFLELCQQFRVLQAVCFQQAKLLQRLLSKDVPTTEMPISKPIQCTDAGDPTCSESPFFRLRGKDAPSSESKTPSEEPHWQLNKEDSLSFPFEINIQFPPNMDQYSFLASQAKDRELDIDTSKSNISLEQSEINALFLWKNYSPSIPYHDSIPTHPDYTLSLSDIYEELQPKDKSAEDIFGPQNGNSSGVRGPAQSSWSPGCLSEECQLYHHEDTDSDVGFSSQICEFCQAVFPAGAATKSEYLQHITGHVE